MTTLALQGLMLNFWLLSPDPIFLSNFSETICDIRVNGSLPSHASNNVTHMGVGETGISGKHEWHGRACFISKICCGGWMKALHMLMMRVKKQSNTKAIALAQLLLVALWREQWVRKRSQRRWGLDDEGFTAEQFLQNFRMSIFVSSSVVSVDCSDSVWWVICACAVQSKPWMYGKNKDVFRYDHSHSNCIANDRTCIGPQNLFK